MADRLSPLSWPRQPGKRRCGSCGKLYVGRPRRKPYASPATSGSGRGEAPAAIGVRFGIPRFLVDAVLEYDPQPDSHPS